MSFLAPVARESQTPRGSRRPAAVYAVGCAACHTPSWSPAQVARPTFDRQAVALFSDLLLHDIGTGDDIPQAAACPEEIRTPALWGLRLRRPLLHDGSAATIEEAIRSHAGEALSTRRRFETLPDASVQALLAFLRSL